MDVMTWLGYAPMQGLPHQGIRCAIFGHCALIRMVAFPIVLCLLVARLDAAELVTSDGISLRLDDQTGRPAGFSVNGRDLPFLDGVPGGLTVRFPVPATQGRLFSESFETSPTWTSAQNANWNTAATYYTQTMSGGIDDSAYVRLGNGVATGCGIAFPAPIGVQGGARVRVSWQARSTNILSKFILCIRCHDAEGNDVTSTTVAPTGWGYSATSQAHAVYGMTNTTTGTWELITSDYFVPEAIETIRVSLRYWTDGDRYVDVDDLRLDVIGGVVPGVPIGVSAPVTMQSPDVIRQEAFLSSGPATLAATWRASSNAISLSLDFETSATAADVPIQAVWSLPIDARGWQWGDDILSSRTIASGVTYDNTFRTVGRKVSLYPWSGLWDAQTGVALAVPTAAPRLQQTFYSAAEGFATRFDLCLSSRTLVLGPGKASASFLLYQFSPEWGFRSSAKGFYARFPECFTKRTSKDGCWLYPIGPDQIANPQDFGFSFFECNPQSQSVRDRCAELGIGIYYYFEPWGAWQTYTGVTEKPSYEARVNALRAWAADTASTAKWLRAPRSYAAQSILNSLYSDATGKYPIDAYSYYWSYWGAGTSGSQFWPCHADSDFSTASLGTLHKNYLIDPTGSERQGMYVDSVSADGTMGNLEDRNPAHHAGVKTPLAYSLVDGGGILAAPLGHYDYLKWLSDYEHAAGRILMGNTFATAYRFYAHLFDVAGSEVFDSRESSATEALRRTLTYRKANTNLLQWWHGDDLLDGAKVEDYIQQQLYWGFFPGIASCGGGIGLGLTLQRYFLHPELYERDRPVFRKYIPIIRELSRAGWEPVTRAWTSDRAVSVERFGEWSAGRALFTLRSDATSTASVDVCVDCAGLGISAAQQSRLLCAEVITSTSVAVQPETGSRVVLLGVVVPPGGVRALRLTEATSRADADSLFLYP